MALSSKNLSHLFEEKKLSSPPTQIIGHFNNIIIIGAGILGLYAANKLYKNLKKSGDTATNIFLFDVRAGQYIRPGALDANIIKLILEEIENTPLNKEKEKETLKELGFTEAGHIKEVERYLYKKLIELPNVHFVLKKLHKISEDGNHLVFFDNAEKNEENIPFSNNTLFLDATGSKRALTLALNNFYKEKKPFQITPLTGDQQKKESHFYAYITVKDAKTFTESLKSPTDIDPLKTVLHIEKLKSIYKWPKITSPYFNVMPAGKHKKTGRDKFSVYVQKPDDLSPELAKPWFLENLSLRTNQSVLDVEFLSEVEQKKIQKSKIRMQHINVDPQQVFPCYLVQEKLNVFIIGDATMDPVYTTGYGIESGISRFNALLENMQFEKGLKSIDVARYTEAHEKLRVSHVKIIQERHYDSEYNRSLTEFIKTIDLYKDSLIILSQNQNNSLFINSINFLIIFNAMNNILIERSNYLKNEFDKFNALFIGKTDKEKTAIYFSNKDLMNNHKNNFIKLINSLKKINLPQSESFQLKANQYLIKIAHQYKQQGDNLFANKNYEDSAICYDESLEIYSQFFPDIFIYNAASALNNLMKILNENKYYLQVIPLFTNKNYSILKQLKIKTPYKEEENPFRINIFTNYIIALLGLADECLASNPMKVDQADQHCHDAKHYLNELSRINGDFPILNELQTRLTILSEKISLTDDLQPIQPTPSLSLAKK